MQHVYCYRQQLELVLMLPEPGEGSLGTRVQGLLLPRDGEWTGNSMPTEPPGASSLPWF